MEIYAALNKTAKVNGEHQTQPTKTKRMFVSSVISKGKRGKLKWAKGVFVLHRGKYKHKEMFLFLF